MTLNTLRFRAPLRTPAEPTRVCQDQSLTYVVWLLLFLVFAPMVGVHVAFVLFPDPAETQTVQGKGSLPGKHG
jgi:hypothetical protein